MVTIAKYVFVFLISFYAVFLIIQAILFQLAERRLKSSKPTKAQFSVPEQHEPEHEHEWRKVTIFGKQCQACKAVEVTITAPDGLKDYLELVASAKTPKESVLRAEEYKFYDHRNAGLACPGCQRIIPVFEQLPRSPYFNSNDPPACPYCGMDLLETFSLKDKN